jgi:hypothetical protein
MKRLRDEETRQQTSSFVFHDVPCVHAGYLRQPEFWSLRARCLELHVERRQLCVVAKTTSDLLKKRDAQATARSLLTHDLVLQSLAGAGGLTHSSLEKKLCEMEEGESLVAAAERVWKRTCGDEMARFNARIGRLRDDIVMRAVEWTQTAVCFKRHLYKAYGDCECFLCLDPSGSLEAENRPLCYLCAMRPPQQDNAASWHASRMCRPCCGIAQRRGLCTFCWGHIEFDGETCRGREDFRRERAVACALDESSTVDIFGF